MNSQSVFVQHVYLDAVGIIVGKLEKDGPLRRYFKNYIEDIEKYSYNVVIDYKEKLNQLKKAGYRITEQRKLLLHIILNNEYSSCKEIYYAAKKQDDKVGIATVYRTVQLLEDMELIHKEMVVRI